jgi:Flp pilus assembly pilin Flp
MRRNPGSPRRGFFAIEYALIAALVAVAAIAAFTFLGTQLGVEFSAVANQLEDN